MRLDYILRPPKIALLLGAIALYLSVQSLIAEYLLEHSLPDDAPSYQFEIIDLFSVNIEESIPTWYAALLLFFAAVLLAFVTAAKYRQRDAFRYYWLGLSLLFVYLSMDEGAAIHEIAGDLIKAAFSPTGYLYFAWQIAFVPPLILLGLIYLRFLLHLPRRFRHLFLLAGAIYVGGAVVIEGISANQWYLDGGQSFRYLAIATVEECFEMLGAVLFIYALLAYIVQHEYALLLQPRPEIAAAPSYRVLSPQPSPGMSRWLLRSPGVFAVVLVLGLNTAVLSWASTQTQSATPADPTAINQAMIDQLTAQEVAVTHLVGRFELDNLEARAITAALLRLYDEVIVLTWQSSESSIALAASQIPFSRDDLIEILHSSGETQFMIYETAAVRAIVGEIQAASVSH